ncbi:hypothetical protein ACOMHN_002605 [Nucella lapillus]
MFQQYFRLSREQFSEVLFLIGDTLIKDNRIRDVISPRERLAVCLRVEKRTTSGLIGVEKRTPVVVSLGWRNEHLSWSHWGGETNNCRGLIGVEKRTPVVSLGWRNEHLSWSHWGGETNN